MTLFDDIKDRFREGVSNRAFCSLCERPIPKEMRRIEWNVASRYPSGSTIRICEECIILASLLCDKKKIKEVRNNAILEAI